jgi:hypothetical protein
VSRDSTRRMDARLRDPVQRKTAYGRADIEASFPKLRGDSAKFNAESILWCRRGDSDGYVSEERAEGRGGGGQSDVGMPSAASSCTVARRPLAHSTTSDPVTHAEPFHRSTTV